ncbi:hypothetical protein GQ472_04675 [archaeon]|nr:hypothetical protein [archaeon]
MPWEQPIYVGNRLQPVTFRTGGKEYEGKIIIQNFMNYPEKGVITDWGIAGFGITEMTTDPENEEAVSLVIRNEYLIDPKHLDPNKKFNEYDTETRKKITIKDFKDIAEIYPAKTRYEGPIDENGLLKSVRLQQNWIFEPLEDCIEKTFEKLSFADITQILVNIYERQIQITRHKPAIINLLKECRYQDTNEKINENDLKILRDKYIIENETLRRIFDDKGNLTLKTLTDIKDIPKVMKDYIEKHAGEIEKSYLYRTMITRHEEDIDKLTELNKIYEKIIT